MENRYKDIVSIAIILILLPYVITLFMNGRSMGVKQPTSGHSVKVCILDKENPKVIEVDWEDYLMGILAKETPIDFEKEALKSQIILIRTRLYHEVNTYINNGGDPKAYKFQEAFWNMEKMEKQWKNQNQNGNINAYIEKLEQAVEQTEHLILTYEGTAIHAPFHQCNNGSTRNGNEVFENTEYPYLIAKECLADKKAKKQKNTITFPYGEVGAGVGFADIKIEAKDTAGYAIAIQVGDHTYTGEEFRKDFHLSSSCIAFQDYYGKLRITTQGTGHGLGMSQNTANTMAKEKQTYEEILGYFFEGTQIKDAGEIFAKLE
ncbi:MAG: SpoIID/LytB domain-containing protein [Lachnospiraceae bacterium]